MFSNFKSYGILNFIWRFLCSEEENDDDDDNDGEKDDNMDTSEVAATTQRNPDDEFNFADYDNEGNHFKTMLNMSAEN